MAEKTRTCPYCKEEIKPDATRCKYCRSQLQAVEPSHGGTCPYCKEAIHPGGDQVPPLWGRGRSGVLRRLRGRRDTERSRRSTGRIHAGYERPPGQLSTMAARSSVTSVPLPYVRCDDWTEYTHPDLRGIFHRRCCFMVPIIGAAGTVVDLEWQCWRDAGTIKVVR
jgi:hypothetical protein